MDYKNDFVKQQSKVLDLGVLPRAKFENNVELRREDAIVKNSPVDLLEPQRPQECSSKCSNSRKFSSSVPE